MPHPDSSTCIFTPEYKTRSRVIFFLQNISLSPMNALANYYTFAMKQCEEQTQHEKT